MKAQPALRGQRKVRAKTTAVPIDRAHEARPSGTGKSHLVEALAHAAIEKDLRVAWFTLETPTAAIARAKADGSVARTCRSDLIVVDDISMLPAGRTPPRPSTGSPTPSTSTTASRSARTFTRMARSSAGQFPSSWTRWGRPPSCRHCARSCAGSSPHAGNTRKPKAARRSPRGNARIPALLRRIAHQTGRGVTAECPTLPVA